MGQMRTMGKEGDVRIVWDADDDESVEIARKTFDEGRAKGYNAYAVRRKGEKGEVVRTFDREAEKIILAPPMAGG